MSAPDFQKFIQHHVDTNQIGILTNPLSHGMGEIAVYSFNSKAVNGRDDVILSYDPKAGPQAAALIINTVTDWLKVQTELPDSFVLGTVDIEGMAIEGKPLRVQLIALNRNDGMQFTHEWSKYQYGENYMEKMANFTGLILIQPADPSNLLPGEPGFDEAFRDINYVYLDTGSKRLYVHWLEETHDVLSTISAIELTEQNRPTVYKTYIDLYEESLNFAAECPVIAWLPGHLSRLWGLTMNPGCAFELVKSLNERLVAMIDRAR